MTELFDNITKLMRYGTAGFVALSVVWMIDNPTPPERNVLFELNDAVGSWWPVLFFAVIIGIITYVVNLSILFRLYVPIRNSIWPLRENSASGILRWDSDEVCELRTIRWLLREPDTEDAKETRRAQDPAIAKELAMLRAKQRLADGWSAHIHFLFCCSWVTFGAACVMRWNGRCGWSEFAWCFGAATVLLLLAIWEDVHCEKLKRAITVTWKDLPVRFQS